MSGIETMNEMLAKDPGLQEKVNAEIRRLAGSCVGAAIGAVGGGIFGSWLEDNF